ncbi:MAG: aromatic ring-hydroxylating dioxygenase subunit alpha, partial [Ideonella sp.]|nr:aromatic ring-hydroxylating dioxygenase subunit alpha [Ideonella sp.]
MGIDPAHTSFLHRFFRDASLDDTYGKQFRGASVGEVGGERWPMSRIMREFHRPEIRHEPLADGLWRITTLRRMHEGLMHVRITNSVFPNTFVIPLSETITITQLHVPVDDENVYWYSLFTSFDAPLDKAAMREQRLRGATLPDYLPRKGRHNDWGYDP